VPPLILLALSIRMTMSMAVLALIVPPLEILPEKLLTVAIEMPSAAAEIVPELEMPPEKVEPVMAIAVGVGVDAVILLAESSEMPPAIVPVLEICPDIVPLVNFMPEGLIVPELSMLPVKLVAVTQRPVTAAVLL
ncbi:MAG: hypothetical protein WBE51_18490, partial [Xanthobacteraceae bacterium]